MNRKILIAIVIIVAVIAAGLAYVALNKDTSAPANNNETQDTTSTVPERENASPGNTAIAGAYVDYSPEKVANASGEKILFFHAPWCPQCRAAEKSIKEANLPDNLTIFKVDYDTNQALRQQYGVTLQTTFVKIDDKGNKVESFVAYDEPTFDAVKRELID